MTCAAFGKLVLQNEIFSFSKAEWEVEIPLQILLWLGYEYFPELITLPLFVSTLLCNSDASSRPPTIENCSFSPLIILQKLYLMWTLTNCKPYSEVLMKFCSRAHNSHFTKWGLGRMLAVSKWISSKVLLFPFSKILYQQMQIMKEQKN